MYIGYIYFVLFDLRTNLLIRYLFWFAKNYQEMLYKLKKAQMQKCMAYVYKEENLSIHERLMKPVWTKMESYIPQRICATTISLVGLVANIIPCTILMTMAPTATETVSYLSCYTLK